MNFKSTKFRQRSKKIGYIIVGWLLVATFQVFYDFIVATSFTDDPTRFRLTATLISTWITISIAGLFAGTFIIDKVEPWLRRLPFWKALIQLFLFYIVAGFVMIAAGAIFFQSLVFRSTPLDPIVQQEIIYFLTGLDFLKFFIFWGFIFIGTIILLMIYDKYGPGNFRNLLLGRYFHPQEEERIFMFLDLRSSTSIAEELGDLLYFQFFHDFINEATEPILYAKGEIYQYIGDEIIVSWKMKNGLENNNCLNCFFDIKAAFRAKRPYFLKKYGYSPEFKAGLHYGPVISGEIGAVKKEIAFSGDVLNTASRIQNECNKHQLDLLLSDELLDLLKKSEKYQAKSIGTIQLRGKAEGIGLSTILEK